MFVLVVVSGLWIALIVGLRGPLRSLRDEHALAGRFGSVEREAVIGAYAGNVVATAERIERLGTFARELRGRAWSGSPITIAGRRGDWRSWTFADGERWRVRHASAPKIGHQRVVVAATDDDQAGLDVRAYVPGSHDVRLPIVDAIDPRSDEETGQVPFGLT